MSPNNGNQFSLRGIRPHENPKKRAAAWLRRVWPVASLALLLVTGAASASTVRVHGPPAKPSPHNPPSKTPDDLSGPTRTPNSQLEPLAWSDLEGWSNDDQASAFSAFLVSCR